MRSQEQKIQRVQSDVVYWSAIHTGNPEPGSCSMTESSVASSLNLFEYIPPTTFAERFPVLTCFAIACTLLAAALMTEIECLQGCGYFWR
jgi:hypothetical protein